MSMIEIRGNCINLRGVLPSDLTMLAPGTNAEAYRRCAVFGAPSSTSLFADREEWTQSVGRQCF